MGTILEGGAIDSNGAGTLLTTEAVLLHSNRNGPNEKGAVETTLSEGLGAEQVLWLKDGLVGDDTDGHVDNIARFFREDGILLSATVENSADPNAVALEENYSRLSKACLPTVVPLSWCSRFCRVRSTITASPLPRVILIISV